MGVKKRPHPPGKFQGFFLRNLHLDAAECQKKRLTDRQIKYKKLRDLLAHENLASASSNVGFEKFVDKAKFDILKNNWKTDISARDLFNEVSIEFIKGFYL